MASETEINAVVDAIVGAFGGDADLFGAFLERAKLETELRALESDARNMQAAEDVQNAAYADEYMANVEAQQAKRAEIDAL